MNKRGAENNGRAIVLIANVNANITVIESTGLANIKCYVCLSFVIGPDRAECWTQFSCCVAHIDVSHRHIVITMQINKRSMHTESPVNGFRFCITKRIMLPEYNEVSPYGISTIACVSVVYMYSVTKHN